MFLSWKIAPGCLRALRNLIAINLTKFFVSYRCSAGFAKHCPKCNLRQLQGPGNWFMCLNQMVYVIRCRPYFSLPSEEMFGRDFCEPVCHALIGVFKCVDQFMLRCNFRQVCL